MRNGKLTKKISNKHTFYTLAVYIKAALKKKIKLIQIQ